MKLERLINTLEKHDLDAVVAVSLENVFYSTGAYILTQKHLPDRLELAVWPRKSEPVFIVCDIEESLAIEAGRISDVRKYVEFAENPLALLADVFEEKNLSNATVGIELTYLPAKYYLELIDRLPSTKLVECKDLFYELRAIKEPHEVEVLEKAAKATRKAILASSYRVGVNSTEKDFSTYILQDMLTNGANETLFSVVATGLRTNLAHAVPSDIPMKSGEVMRLDVGGIFDGYCSDVARTFGIGDVPSYKRDLYTKLRSIERDTIYAMKPGVTFAEIFEFCKNRYKEEGLDFFMPHIGHNLGIGLHEDPMVHPFEKAELEPGMIINIEPMIRDTKANEAYHIEDLALITDDEPRILTGANLDNFELPIID